MATETLDAPGTTDAQRVKALSGVLGLIAGDLNSVVELIHEAVGNPIEKAPHLVAVAALAERLGWMADVAAKHSGDSGCKGSDEWLLSPAARQAMRTLGASI